MRIITDDPGLEINEAIQLLDLLFFTFENADNERDWFSIRPAIGSGLHATQSVLYNALRRCESRAAGSDGKAAH